MLKDANAFIQPRTDLPSGSMSARVRAGENPSREEIDADLWFANWERGGTLLEEARHLTKWDQTLTLIWFESGDVPSARAARRERRWEYEGRERPQGREEEEHDGLKELDGNLRWNRKDRYR
jgi:hypothetical protein